MGFGAQQAVGHWRKIKQGSSLNDRLHSRALDWLEKLGPKACLMAWLPGVGDPLCAVAGWLKMPIWQCSVYMAIGKFARYLMMTSSLMWLFPN